MSETMENAKPAKKSLFKKWWFWAIVAVVVIAIAAGAGSGDASQEGQSGNESGKQSSPAAANKIGDTVRVGDMEFTVTAVTDTSHIGDSYLGQDTENNYVIVTLTARNVGNQEVTLFSSFITLLNGNKEYEMDDSAGLYLGDNGFVITKSVGAGLAKTLQIVFETPEAHTEDYCVKFTQGFRSEKVYLK